MTHTEEITLFCGFINDPKTFELSLITTGLSKVARADGTVLSLSGRKSVQFDPGWFASCVGSVFHCGE